MQEVLQYSYTHHPCSCVQYIISDEYFEELYPILAEMENEFHILQTEEEDEMKLLNDVYLYFDDVVNREDEIIM